RVVIALLAAFAGWLFGGLIARGLCRLIARRPLPPTGEGISRVVIAVGLGLLGFWVLGELGFGRGPGTGGGEGKDGQGDVAGKKDGKTRGKQDDTKEGKGKGKPDPETLQIELVLSSRYEPGSGRAYLLDGKEPPLTLAEIDKQLGIRKDKLKIV